MESDKEALIENCVIDLVYHPDELVVALTVVFVKQPFAYTEPVSSVVGLITPVMLGESHLILDNKHDSHRIRLYRSCFPKNRIGVGGIKLDIIPLK